MRETLIPRQAVISHIHERFWLLMDEHRLSVLDVARLLSDWNIGLSVLESRERTLDYLTTPLLMQLSEWFYVSAQWLEGSDARPVHLAAFSQWMEVGQEIKKRIQKSTSDDTPPPGIFLARENKYSSPNIAEDPENVFIFIRHDKTVNRHETTNIVTISTVECLGYCPSAGENKTQLNYFLSMANVLFRTHILKNFDILYTSGYLLETLKKGEVLPATVLREIQKCHNTESGQFYKNIWADEERKPFLFPLEYTTPEWSELAREIITLNIP